MTSAIFLSIGTHEDGQTVQFPNRDPGGTWHSRRAPSDSTCAELNSGGAGSGLVRKTSSWHQHHFSGSRRVVLSRLP